MEHEIFSEKHVLRLIHEGSSKTTFEYCEDSKRSFVYFRANQGHSGGIPIDSELVDVVHSDTLPMERVCFSLGLFLQH